MASPRVLLRQPYGRDSDSIDSFPFEELTGDAVHERYLWGNPAFFCGYLLADAFKAEGWEAGFTGAGEVGGVPVHKFRQDGETKVKACAEAWLTDRAAEVIERQGIMPFQSVKGRDAVRLVNMRSIAQPTKSLPMGS